MFVSVIIAAAGSGKRMKSNTNKPYLCIKSKPILAHTIEVFEKCKGIDEIVIVTKKEEISFCTSDIVRKYGYKKVTKVIAGGKERQDSIYEGIKSLSKECNIVMVHDGARPFVENKHILESIEKVKVYKAVGLGVPVKDTIKVVDEENFIVHTPKRESLWAIQTPQTFQYEIIKDAYTKALKENFLGTDDASLVERLGNKVVLVEGSYENIKITTPEDLYIGESILSNRQKRCME